MQVAKQIKDLLMDYERSLPDAEVHALDLSSVVTIVPAGRTWCHRWKMAAFRISEKYSTAQIAPVDQHSCSSRVTHWVPVAGIWLVDQTTSHGSGAAGAINHIRIRMTRANSEKCALAGADDPTGLVFVQMIVLAEQVPSIEVLSKEE